MPSSSASLSTLDFDLYKNTLKAYLKSQNKFADYDFDGSNMNVLLDLLAYNAYQSGFYLNMVGNEMFLDTAQLRDSVVSHAKELNYTPRSFTSAYSNVNITCYSSDPGDFSKRTLLAPKGTTFTAKLLNKAYTFSLSENLLFEKFALTDNDITFTADNVLLYEGTYVTDTYTYDASNPRRLLISNRTADISSLSITVVEDSGATLHTYTRALSLFDIDSDSKVFFVQGAENDSYEIMFGDGVSGRKPKDNSVIVIEYRTSSGELPNGCNSFKCDESIGGLTDITVVVNTAASGGSVYESIDSIRFNAPRHFNTQERAITTEDYETLLKIKFPEVNAVTAYGGEDLDPPQFGKVFVSVDLNDVDALPDSKRNEYYQYLKPRSPVSIDPVFVDPEYLYLGVVSTVKYNINTTRLSMDDIKTIVQSAIIKFAQNNLNNFNKTFRYSQLVQAIDTSQLSVISNETDVSVIKVINPVLGSFETFDVNYALPLDVDVFKSSTNPYCIKSSVFVYKGIKAILRDDGQGTMYAISVSSEAPIESVGKINYDKGLLQFSKFKVDSFIGSGIKITALPKHKDISTTKNVIINIIEEDINLQVEVVRL